MKTGMTRTAMAQKANFALHTLGWKAFQDLCACICTEVLDRPVEIYREAQDGGQDAVFATPKSGPNDSQDCVVQCKFSADPTQTFKVSEFKAELNSVEKLVADGHAQSYIVLTSKSVSGVEALTLKRRLREIGVKHPHVFGKEFITLAIIKNAALRALVPRVYGLGDLSIILDERAATQTSALLGHLVSTFNVYVPTEAHKKAVTALEEKSLVLLLGDPATGKSTIAAILGARAAASKEAAFNCFKIDDPRELLKNWNPNERGAFFWIDDAFGANQLRDDFIDAWLALISKIQAATAQGNFFVLTSRTHIYNSARSKLGTRNHPNLNNGESIVHVGRTTAEEREQILYNHIKAGGQTMHWKRRVKPFLPTVAQEKSFLPEIARRIADPQYTKTLDLTESEVLDFVRKPKEHLIELIKELPSADKAALTNVLLHQNALPKNGTDPDQLVLLEKYFGRTAEEIGSATDALMGSFLEERKEIAGTFINFKHPTLADALSRILGETSGLVELYIETAKLEALLVEVVCEGQRPIQNAIVIPRIFDSKLVNQIAKGKFDPSNAKLLFEFLYRRANDAVFTAVIQRRPDIFALPHDWTWSVIVEAKAVFCTRAHALGLLPYTAKAEVAARIESALIDRHDTRILEDEPSLSLLGPYTLINLRHNIIENLLPRYGEYIKEFEEGVDYEDNFNASDVFDDVRDELDHIEGLMDGFSDIADTIIDECRGLIQEATERISDRQNLFEDDSEEYGNWASEWRRSGTLTGLPIGRSAFNSKQTAPTSDNNASPRSSFSDVDQ